MNMIGDLFERKVFMDMLADKGDGLGNGRRVAYKILRIDMFFTFKPMPFGLAANSIFRSISVIY